MTAPIKATYLSIAAFAILVVTHNFFSAITGFEEPLFFILSLIAGVVFVFSIIFNIWTYTKTGSPYDIWKLGFLGLIGLLGIIPKLGTGFFGFFGLFGFLGLCKRVEKGNNKSKVNRK